MRIAWRTFFLPECLASVLGDDHHPALPALGDDDALLYTGALWPLCKARPEVGLYRLLLGVGTVEPVMEIVRNNAGNTPR